MESELKRIDQRNESIATAAGFILVLVLGAFALYSRQKKSLNSTKEQLASKDERN